MNTSKADKRVWGIRAGKKGEAHDLFLQRSLIALASTDLGDLSKLEPTRDAFYVAYRELKPDETIVGTSSIGGKFFRFVHEVTLGSLVVYPALPDKKVYVGEVAGSYLFVENESFPHQRKIRWKYVIPKAEFSQDAQYELGAARTFFEFKRNAEELTQMIGDGKFEVFQKNLLPQGRKESNRDSVVRTSKAKRS